MGCFHLETFVPSIHHLRFYPFNTKHKELRVVRCMDTVVGIPINTVRTTTVYTVYTTNLPFRSRNSRSIFLYFEEQVRGYRVDSLLQCLCKLEVITSDEEKKHLDDVEKEREKIIREDMARELYRHVENDKFMAKIAQHAENLEELLTSKKEVDRKLGTALCRFKQILNGTPLQEIVND